MYIAKNGNSIVLANSDRETLEKQLKFMNYTSIEKTDVKYELYKGKYLSPKEIAEIQKQERIEDIKEELNKIDLKSIRALRAGETERLEELEAQAEEYREELHFLID